MLLAFFFFFKEPWTSGFIIYQINFIVIKSSDLYLALTSFFPKCGTRAWVSFKLEAKAYGRQGF